jgi:hypothetical protein
LRLNFEHKITEQIIAFVSYDNELLVHDLQEDPDFDLIRQQNQKNIAFWDTSHVLLDEDNFYWRHLCHRAYIKYHTPQLGVIIGKQAVDWSRMRFYKPFDLFNPVSPLDIEQKEKIGVDAVNVEWYPDEFFMINAVFSAGENREKRGMGLRLSHKILDYDIFAVGAEVKKDIFIGAGFDGYIGEAGFRGEITHGYADGETDKEFLRGSIGLDHSFTSKLYGIAEYFYNGLGTEDNIARFLSSVEFSRRLQSIRKHIVGAGIEYDFTGITTLASYVFYDIDGESFYINPEFRWNIKPSWDLNVGVQILEGDDDSEFGSYHDVFYAEMKYFF